MYKGVEYQKNSKKMRMKRLTVVLVALLVAVALGYCQTKRDVNAARKEAAAAAKNLKRGWLGPSSSAMSRPVWRSTSSR